MMHPLSTPPRVNIYRTTDGLQYVLMDLAMADPGHYVGWGELHVMGRGQAMDSCRDRVMHSLKEFPCRNGQDKVKRLHLKGMEPFHLHHDMVSVRAISSTTLEFTPYRRGEQQHERLKDSSLTVAMDVPAGVFYAEFERAFLRGRG